MVHLYNSNFEYKVGYTLNRANNFLQFVFNAQCPECDERDASLK